MAKLHRASRPRTVTRAVTRFTAAVLLATLVAATTGCGSMRLPEPWVKPYERERLADPVMKSLRDPLAARHREHVLTVREGARGANGVQGGGCGCN